MQKGSLEFKRGVTLCDTNYPQASLVESILAKRCLCTHGLFVVVVVQLLSRQSDWFFATPCAAACQASLSLTISWNLLNLTSTESMMPSNHLILCRPLLLLPLVFSSIRVLSNESALCIRWPAYWNINVNQPRVYMCPPILNPLPSFPIPSLWVVPVHWLWVPCFMHQTCTGHLFYIW